MENELLQSIGRLYVEALRLQSMVQQLQEQVASQNTTIEQLKTVSAQQVSVTSAKQMPPELVATVTPDGFKQPVKTSDGS